MQFSIFIFFIFIIFSGCQNREQVITSDEVVKSKEINKFKTPNYKEFQNKAVVINKTIFQDWNLPDFMNWYSAQEYCENLELNLSNKNYTNWRLPNNQELKTTHQEISKFKNLISDRWYWSSEEYCEENYEAWIVLLKTGETNPRKEPDVDYVFCVHNY